MRKVDWSRSNIDKHESEHRRLHCLWIVSDNPEGGYKAYMRDAELNIDDVVKQIIHSIDKNGKVYYDEEVPDEEMKKGVSMTMGDDKKEITAEMVGFVKKFKPTSLETEKLK